MITPIDDATMHRLFIDGLVADLVTLTPDERRSVIKRAYTAVGMAAAAGLVKLAIVVTILHFVIVLGFTPLTKRLTARLAGSVRLHITYEQNRGVIARIPYTDTKPVAENARLIAACPDLLAVAEEVINNQEALPAYLVAMAIHAVGRAKG